MSLIQARFGEDAYPLGRFILDRARALGISRSELVSRLGYRQIGKGHKALTAALMTGTVPPHMGKHLAVALEVDDTLVDAVVAATTRQQQDEARALILAREAAYRAAFKPHLRTETTRTIPSRSLSPPYSEPPGCGTSSCPARYGTRAPMIATGWSSERSRIITASAVAMSPRSAR
jgi:hypothetical protein